MAKQLHVNMTVDADTSGAQAQLKKLNESLNQIRSKPAALFDNTNLQKASQAAATLQKNLAAATDVKTGKLDLSKFSQSLDKSNMNLKDVRTTLSALGPQGERAFLQLSKSIAQADAPMLRMNAKMRDFMTTLKNTARWQISSSILHGFMGTLQSAYGYAQDLNESLNNIRIVTGQSVDEMARFAKEANKAARELNTTTTAYTDAALIYYQQGLSDDQVKERSNVTAKLANVARESATEVSSYMTAIWNNFNKDGTESLEHFGDVITKLGAETAASTAEIAHGLEKFAAVADTIGLSYEYATSAIATIVDKTRQSEDVVGTALKTIFARIQGLNLGETLEDGTTLNKYSKALESVGISIFTATGELKNMDTILDEMGAKWQTLSKDQQVALAQTVAGVRQYNQLVSLMDNYDAFKGNVDIANSADGALQDQADIYAESWEAARNRVKAAAENIYDSLINEDFFIAFDNGFANVLNLIAGFIDGLGGMQGVLGVIGGFITQHLAKEAPAALERIKDTLSYIKGDALKKAGELQQQNLNELNKTDVSGDDAAYNAEVEGVTRIQVMKQNLLQVQNQLSEAERQAYEYEIQQAEAINDIIVKEGERLNAIRARNKEEEGKLVNKVAEKSGGKGDKFDPSAFRGAEKAAQGYVNKLKEASTAIGKLNALGKKVADQGSQWKKTAANVKDNAKATQDLRNAYQKTFDELKSKVDTSSKSWKDLDKAMSTGTVEEVADAFERLGEDVSVFTTETGANVDSFTQDVDDAAKGLTAMGADSSEVYNLSNGFIEASESASSLNDQMQNANENAAEVPRHVTTMSEAFASSVGAAMALSAAVNSITSFSEIMSDEDATVGQKISAVLAVLTTTFMAFNAVKTAAVAIKSIDTAATMANATSHFVLAAAETAATIAAWPLSLIMLALVGTIGLLVGVVLAVSAAFKQMAANSPEGQLKAAKEKANEAAEAFDRVKTSVEEVHTQLDELANTTDTLDDLTRGTEEWNEAVRNINASVLELLDRYPELVTMITKTEEGVLGLTQEGYDYISSTENNRLATAQNMKIEADKKVLEQQLNVNYSNFEDEKGSLLHNDLNRTTYYTSGYASGGGAYAMPQTVYTNQDEIKEGMQQLYDEWGDSLFTEAGAQAVTELLYDKQQYTEEEFNTLQSNILATLEANKETFKENQEIQQQIALLEDMQLESFGRAFGSNRSAEELKELMGENAYDDALASSRQKVSDTFGDWNDHYNYDTSSDTSNEEWKMIQDFMDLQGDDVEYVAQRWGKMVLEVDGKEIEYTKDEVYDALAELYSGPELEQKLTESLQQSLGAALGGVDLSNVSLDDLNAMDSFRNQIADSLVGTDMEGQGDKMFSQIMGAYGTGQEGIDNFNAATQFVDTTGPEFQDNMQALADGRITVEQFTTALKEMNAAGQIDAMGSFFNQAAEGMGLGEEEAENMQNYAKHLMEVCGEAEGLADTLKEDADSAADLAVEITRMNKGIDDLADGFEDWNDILKESDKTSMEYAEAMSGMKGALANILDVEEDMVSSDFVVDHLDEIAKAAEGDEEAIDSLRASMDEEIILKITEGQTDAFKAEIESLDDTIQDLAMNLPDIEVGAVLQDADFLAAANELVQTAGMTADEANAYFAGIGYEPVYSVTDVEAPGALDTNTQTTSYLDNFSLFNGTEELDLGPLGSYSIPKINPNITWHSETTKLDPTDIESTIPLTSFSGDGKPPEIKGMRKKATGSMNNYSSGNKGGKSPGGKSGGKSGGGSPKSKKTKDKKDINKETERYHEINNAIDDIEETIKDLNREYEKLSTQTDRAFGVAKINLMKKQRQELDKQVDAIDKQIAAQKKLLAEQKKYLNQDKKKAEKAGWKFDENTGNVVDYEKTLKSIVTKYNDEIEKYNNMTAEEQEKYMDTSDGGKDPLQLAEEEYQAALEALKQYEETKEAIEDTENSIADKEKERLEKLQAQYDILLAEVQTEVELKVNVDDSALDLLKDKLADLGDSADNALDVIANINQQVDRVVHKSETYREGIHDTLNTLKDYGVSDEDLKKINSAVADGSIQDMKPEDLQEMFSSSEIVDYSTLISDLQNYSKELLAMNEEIRAYKDQVFETMSAAFNEYLDDLHRYEEKTEHAKKLTQGYKDLITSLGKANIDKDGSLTKKINDALVSESQDALREAQATQEYAQSAFDQAKENYEKYSNQDSPWYNEEMARKWKAQMEECEDALMDAEENTQAALQATAEAITTAFKDSIAQIMEDLDDSLGNVSYLQQQFDQAQELSDQYLDDYKKIYELSKLTRQVHKSMDETNNVKAKKLLMDYQAKINRYQQDGVKMSAYELEHLQKEYELRLAQIQLEEAQNAKSQVRMTRDSEGNYGYVYTADDSAQDDARQNYEDKLYALQELNTQYITEMQRLSLEIQAQWQETLDQILADESLSLEEQQARITEASEFYTQRLAYVNEQLGIAVDNNRTLYEDDWTKYSQTTGYKISADEDYVDTWGETTLAILTGATDQQGYYQSVQIAFQTAVAAIQEEAKKYQAALDAVGLSADALTGKISADVDIQKQKSNEAAGDAESMSQRAQEALGQIMTKADEFSERWVTDLEATIQKNQEYVQSINDMIDALSDLEAAQNTPDNTPSDTPDPDPTNPDPKNPEPDKPNDKEEKAKKLAAEAAEIIKKVHNGSIPQTSGGWVPSAKSAGYSDDAIKIARQAFNDSKSGGGYDYCYKKALELVGYDTGGYTGDWGNSEGRLALLHSKELVLNAQDTENMLAIIDMVRQISNAIDTNALSTLMSSGLTAASVNTKEKDILEQHVTITAEFPNATDKDSILDAFDNVINLAAQYANRR